jgi:hypothetical protein
MKKSEKLMIANYLLADFRRLDWERFEKLRLLKSLTSEQREDKKRIKAFGLALKTLKAQGLALTIDVSRKSKLQKRIHERIEDIQSVYRRKELAEDKINWLRQCVWALGFYIEDDALVERRKK